MPSCPRCGRSMELTWKEGPPSWDCIHSACEFERREDQARIEALTPPA